jgi:hypothetical protein
MESMSVEEGQCLYIVVDENDFCIYVLFSDIY